MTHRIRDHTRRAALIALALLAACGKRNDLAVTDRGDAKSDSKLLPAIPDPCGFVSVADVQRLVGTVKGAPYRGLTADTPDSTAKGHACVFTLAPHATGAETDLLAVELLTDDAVIFELGSSQLLDKLNKENNLNMSVGAENSNGWDYVGGLPTLYVGRLGHLGVQIGTHADWIAEDSIRKLAVLVRDRIPDLPFAAPHKQSLPEDADPCALLTASEVETVTGKLAAAPYRSLDATALAEPRGNGCSYFLGHHRVLSIQPERELGKQLFTMSTSMSQQITSTLGFQGASTDTLEGAWDQAGAGTDGSLIFLKGDKTLTVVYRTANLGTAGALALAKTAMKRL